MRIALGLALLAVVAGAAPAAGQRADARGPAAQVDEVLALSGARRQIDALHASVQARLRERYAALDNEAQSLLGRFLALALRADTVYPVVRARFRADYDAEHVAAALTWFRSPVGRKMARLESQAAAPDAAPALREFESELAAKPPSSERFVLINRVAEAQNQPDFFFDAVRGLAGGIAKGVDRVQATELASRLYELEQTAGTLAGQTRAYIDRETFILLLFTYREARDAELDQYMRFLRSDAGRWHSRTLQQGVIEALDASGEKAVVELMRPPAPAAPARAAAPPKTATPTAAPPAPTKQLPPPPAKR
ncbi:MAG TPA: hypothetical protein VFN71_01930 [Methylomirabilota bacterium]|nr:hypothetical protein [Methylomirabilota bacterium]